MNLGSTTLKTLGKMASPFHALVSFTCPSGEKQVRFSVSPAGLNLLQSVLLAEADVFFLRGQSDRMTRHLKNQSSAVRHFLQGRVSTPQGSCLPWPLPTFPIPLAPASPSATQAARLTGLPVISHPAWLTLHSCLLSQLPSSR